MYVVFAEELEDDADVQKHTVPTLEQAFAQIACRCGLSYHFEQQQEGWRLVFTDIERPDCSPEPVHTDYKRPRDAKYDLIAQAVDGRLKGHVAIGLREYEKRRRTAAQ